MKTQQIRNMINEAVSAEKQSGNLKSAIQTVANLRGVQLTHEQIVNTHDFIKEYIEHVPALLEDLDSAARQAGIIVQINPILEAVEGYFFTPVDIIPDHLGLLGLMDDAYLTHCLIQVLSDSYRDQSGNSFLPLDMSQINQIIRGLIGEPQASTLDTFVINVLNTVVIQQSLHSIVTSGVGFNMAGNDPIWGDASIDQIVTTRLGAMGVV